jgi:putative ABC transport system permease protein
VEGEISQRLVQRYAGRSALTIGVLFISIAAAVAVSNVVFSIADDVRDWYRRTVVVDFLMRTMMPDNTGQETSPMPESLGKEIAAVEGVRMVDSLRHIAASVGDQNALLFARDFNLYEHLPLAAPEALSQDILLRLRDGEAVLGSVLAEKTGLHAGDSLTLSVKEKTHTVRVAGVVSEYAFGGSIVYMDRHVADRLYDLEGVDVFLVAAQSPIPEGLSGKLRAIAEREGLLLQTNSELLRLVNGTINGIVSGLWVLLVLVMLIGALGMVNTLTMNVLEQTRELGMLRAMGLRRGQIVRTVLGQAAYMGLLGILTGSVTGLAMARIFNQCIGSLFGHDVAFDVRPEWIAMVMALGLGTVLGAAALPALRAARLNPIQAMRLM